MAKSPRTSCAVRGLRVARPARRLRPRTAPEDVEALYDAIEAARAETDRPSSSRCARSSAGRRRTRRTPARLTAPPSAPTRSPRSRDPRLRPRASPSSSTTRCSPTPGRSPTRPRRALRSGRSRSTPWRRRTPARRCSVGSGPAARGIGPRCCPTFPADAKGVATRGLRQGAQRPRARAARAVGGSADLAESNNTSIRASRRSCPRPPPRVHRRPVRQDFTSASASTRWARS